MTVLQAFLWSGAFATGLAAAIAFVLHRPLGPLLVELCGNAGRARFWAVFAFASSVLATLSCVLLAAPSDVSLDGAARTTVVFDVLVPGLRAGVFGLLTWLAVLGATLLMAIRSFEAGQRRQKRVSDRGALPEQPS